MRIAARLGCSVGVCGLLLAPAAHADAPWSDPVVVNPGVPAADRAAWVALDGDARTTVVWSNGGGRTYLTSAAPGGPFARPLALPCAQLESGSALPSRAFRSGARTVSLLCVAGRDRRGARAWRLLDLTSRGRVLRTQRVVDGQRIVVAAMSSSGAAVVAWRRAGRAWVRVRTAAGRPLAPPVGLGPTVSAYSYPVAGPRGQLALLWGAPEGVRLADAPPPPSQFVARLRGPGERRFGRAVRIGAGFPQEAAAAFGSSGRLFVVWRAYPDRPLTATTLAAGGNAFTGPLILETEFSQVQGPVVPAPDGGAAVTWATYRGPGPPLVRMAVASASGAFAAARDLAPVGLTDLVRLRDGLVAFSVGEEHPATIRPLTLVAQLGTADGTFGAPETISATASARPAGVAVDAARGRLVVAYPCGWDNPVGSLCVAVRG